MLARASDIYKRTAEANNLSFDIVKSIGKAVMSDLADRMSMPEELAYELDHFGTFIFRHKYFLNYTAKRLDKIDNNPKNPVPEGYVQRLTNMGDKIQEFRKRKEEVKRLKNEYKERTK